MTATPPLDPPERLLCGPGPSNVAPAVAGGHAAPAARPPGPRSARDRVRAGLAAARRLPGDAPASCCRCRPPAPRAWSAGSPTCSSRATRRSSASTASSAGGSSRSPSARGPRSSGLTPTGASTSPTIACSRRSTRTPAHGCSPSCTPRPRPASEHPLAELGEQLRGRDVLLMADCVTSLGGVKLDFDALGDRLRVLVHAEVPRRAARHVTDRDLRPRARTGPRAHAPGLLLVRPRAARALLGQAPGRLSPHGAGAPHLRALRGAARDRVRRARGALGAPQPDRRPTSRASFASADSSCSPSRSISSRRSPPSGSPRASTASASRRGCCASTGSRSAADSARPRPTCGASG